MMHLNEFRVLAALPVLSFKGHELTAGRPVDRIPLKNPASLGFIVAPRLLPNRFAFLTAVAVIVSV